MARSTPLLLLQTPAQLSQHLKALRKARKLTQLQVARRLGVKQARYAFIENHPGTVATEQLLDLLAVLDAEVLLRPRKKAAEPAARDEETW